ncbi:MAG: response regulator, partial [Theionarchaea archaeon]|nr:response regulator [Theionarchaea archaeon]
MKMTSNAGSSSERSGTELIRVLHVDDEPTFLEISKRCLEGEGDFLVDCVTSVEEALEKMENTHYDVIVS